MLKLSYEKSIRKRPFHQGLCLEGMNLEKRLKVKGSYHLVVPTF